ncbi:hypothetical protein O3P69_007225 [Scylla paramamosain]|uniref:Major facilitator superfamily associated domain-containing protein n=1 Tax=Scylla paramamosain TaxID=85552 RepID=A0AAW0V4W5_SCYPA
MGINRKLFPIKIHFFLYWGFMASAPPFVMVVARQMGVPLGVQGVVSAVITAAAVVVRPFIAALADTFPARRKIIFLALISIMIAAYNPIGFLPPLQPSPHLSGQLISSSFLAIDLNSNNSYTNLHLLTPRQQQQSLGECVVTDAWDCFAFCQNHEPCPMLTYHSSGFKFSLQPSHNGLGTEQMENITTSFPMTTNESLKIRHLQEVTPGPNVLKEWQSSTDHTWEKGKGKDMADGTWNLKENQTMVYIIEGVDGWSSKMGFNVSIECQGGVYGKEDGDKEICEPAVLSQAGFWIYVVLLLVAYITATTVESISDAVCCDTIGYKRTSLSVWVHQVSTLTWCRVSHCWYRLSQPFLACSFVTGSCGDLEPRR